jgi:hypothetical protein
MAPVRLASIGVALLLGATSGAFAQMVEGPPAGPGQNPGGFPAQGHAASPGQMPGSGPGVMGLPGQGPEQAPPCMAEFLPLRTATEKHALAIKAAAGKHATPQELCPLFVQFLESEAKVVQFFREKRRHVPHPASRHRGDEIQPPEGYRDQGEGLRRARSSAIPRPVAPRPVAPRASRTALQLATRAASSWIVGQGSEACVDPAHKDGLRIGLLDRRTDPYAIGLVSREF